MHMPWMAGFILLLSLCSVRPAVAGDSQLSIGPYGESALELRGADARLQLLVDHLT